MNLKFDNASIVAVGVVAVEDVVDNILLLNRRAKLQCNAHLRADKNNLTRADPRGNH